ncbi:hexose kinase, 1-phosphofructokinase family [Thermanaerovibrio velox DSM 12556]|uniref:Hexose kinase, 1-phosphofructokinase family n=1 Tax=Thermanaerovibrio velox DSM 12556 TaxID=926567 RepID=H0UN16_9BACT|nr:1-phosphofructokinase family hexose kinase [Thermanaerovibrio velox]EHM09295.1 hexose kinase, 1-phosphofructokinase family [Thermanaerovibrio velox DSM 12556]
MEEMGIATVTLNPAKDRTVFLEGFKVGDVNRAQGDHVGAAGKGINVASFLGDYGHRNVRALGIIGEEDLGFFLESLRRRGVRGCFTPVPGRVRENIKISDLGSRIVTDINLPGLNWRPWMMGSVEDAVRESGAKVVVLSGSLPPGCPLDTWARLVDFAKALGKKVIVDTSGEPLRLAIEARPDGVKPNLRELSEVLRLREGPGGIVEAAVSLREAGIIMGALSLGADGALFFSAEELLLVRPPKVEALTTVGAGDAMVAAMALGMERGMSLREVASLGAAFAICAITKLDPPRVDPERVAELVKRIKISEVEA